MGSSKEIVPIVNSKDKVIGKATKIESKKLKLRHRGVHIFVLNKNGQILINQRAATKIDYPNKYDTSFGGYVKYGETYENAAVREVMEELGLNYKPKLISLKKYLCRDNMSGDFFVKTYTFVLKGKYKLQKSEIKSAMWTWIYELNSLSKKIDFSADRLQILRKALKFRKFAGIVKKLEENIEFVPIVDINNKVIGKTSIDNSANKVLRHRAVRIYLKDKNGNYFLLERPKGKRYYPDCWEIGVSGSVRFGETYLATAKREILEETGLKISNIKKLMKTSETGEIDKWNAIIYIANFSGKPKLQKEEVTNYKLVKGQNVLSFLSDKKVHPLAIKYFKTLVKKGKIKFQKGKQEYWQIYNSNGKRTGKCIAGDSSRSKRTKKIWFAASVVAVLNSKKEILLQKRSKDVYFPFKWDISAAGHVNYKNNFLNTAIKETQEELGIKIKPKKIAEFKLPLFRYHYTLFAVKYNEKYSGKLSFNWEVEELKWVKLGRINSILKKRKMKITPWLKYIINNYSKELENYAGKK